MRIWIPINWSRLGFTRRVPRKTKKRIKKEIARFVFEAALKEAEEVLGKPYGNRLQA